VGVTKTNHGDRDHLPDDEGERLADVVRDTAGRNGKLIVISSSGMATAGRVLHHMAAALPDPRHTVLFVGYIVARHGGTIEAEAADGGGSVFTVGLPLAQKQDVAATRAG
jgi:predicted metal-dependent RNase